MYRISKTRKIVGLVALLCVVGGIVGPTKTSALYTTAQINTRLANGTATAVGWDTTCRKHLYSNITTSGTNALRSSINGDGSYLASSYTDKSWLSGQNKPNIQSPTPVVWGQTSVPLQINSVTFLCGPLVSPETYSTTTTLPKSPYSLNLYNQTSRWVLSSANANDRSPNQIGTTNMRPARVDTFTKIVGYQIVGNANATMSGVGSTIYIQRNGTSRYWFPSGPVKVTYTDPAGITKPTTVTIVMRYKVIQGYHALSGPNRIESCSGQNLANNLNIDACDVKTTTLTITFAPTAALSAKTVANKAAVFPGETVTFTHTITKTGAGNATYYKRICGAYSATKVSAPGGCGARTVATNNYSQAVNVTVPINTTNIGQYYCQRITYAISATAPADAGSSVAACVLVKPVAVSCGDFDVTPTDPDSATRFSIRVSVASPSGVPQLPATMTLELRPFAGNTFTYGPTSQAVTATSYPVETTFGSIGPTNETGRWQVVWVYKDAAGTNLTCGFPVDNTAVLPIANKPYVAVYGGDVKVGDSPTTETSCLTNAEGGAYSWSNYTTNFKGAGSQYAVMALGAIREFAGSLGTTTPDKLVFANVDYGPASTVHDVATGYFGGMFGATGTPCDFLSDTVSVPNSSVTNISGRSVTSNNDVMHVGNDVYISGNITYATTSWANLSAIPSFRLIVEGDIYIDNNAVTQLDGLYVALSNEDGTSGGHIYTCATSIGNDVKPTTPNFYDTCHTKLTVNGAFVAKQIHFLRTDGTLGFSTLDSPTSSKAAEVFNYTPELWLPRGTGQVGGRYMSITGLPPIL